MDSQGESVLKQINYAFDCYAISAISMEEVHNQSFLGLLVGCPALQTKPKENHTLIFFQLNTAAVQGFASVRSWVILSEPWRV